MRSLQLQTDTLVNGFTIDREGSNLLPMGTKCKSLKLSSPLGIVLKELKWDQGGRETDELFQFLLMC